MAAAIARVNAGLPDYARVSDLVLADASILAMDTRRLEPGMLLARNLHAENGMLLLNEGKPLTRALIDKLIPRIEKLKVGPYTGGNDVDYGPVVTKAAKENILRLITSGVDQGATLVTDGRNFSLQGYEDGFFVGPTLFDNVTTDMDIYRQEIFGPVLSTVRAKSYEEAVGYAMDHEYGNGTAIFTRDGDTARDFASRINVGMVGINVPIPVPLAYHTFGGWKKSGFGDLNQHGADGFRFYTRTKTVTSRWPSGIKEGASLNFKQMD